MESARHAHLCLFFSSSRAQANQAAAFLAEGLRANERGFIAAASLAAGRILAALERASASGDQITVLPLSVKSLDRDHALAALARSVKRRGVETVRVVGDMSGIQGALAQRHLLSLETELQRITRSFPIRVLCLYDVRRLSGIQASALLRAHPDMLRPPVDIVTGSSAARLRSQRPRKR